MKLLHKILSVLCLQLTMFGLFPGAAMALVDAATPKTRIDSSGNSVSVWNAIVDGHYVVQAASRSSGGTWSSISTISDSLAFADFENNQPALYMNGNGDALVLWQFIDNTDSNAYIAASMLPVGTTTWYTATVSTSEENAAYGDQTAALNDSGDIIVMWTAFNPVVPQIRAAYSLLETSPTWTTPETISE
jgi:hypothetical protein